MPSFPSSWLIGLTLAGAFAATAAAQPLNAAPSPPAAPPGATTAFAQPVDVATLNTYRGGTQQVHNDMTLNGTTADNTAWNVTTGNNTLGAGAFANMSGLPVVIQNSGANVLIQSAVILHLELN